MGFSDRDKSSRVRIKICGITRPQDALAAARFGADAVGLVFFPGSPRAINVDVAGKITSALPPFVSRVGLFVNATEAEIRDILDAVPLDVLQFHGDEQPEACRRYSKPYIKAVRMHTAVDLNREAGRYADASALLLDTYVKDIHGGTGQAFDWSTIPRGIDKPLILAGGLTADNVAAAVRQVRPYAVDVSGGVESAKGIKDADKMAEFIREVRHAERVSLQS